MSIQTPIVIYSSNRLLQGGSVSANHIQAVPAEKFERKVERMLEWLDDFLLHAKDEKPLLDDFEAYLSVRN